MAINEPNIETIDRYLKQELSKEELLEFELNLSQNQALAEKVEKVRLANKLILKHRLWEAKALAKERIEEGKQNKFFRSKWIIGGLLSLVMMGLAGWWLKSEDKPKPSSAKTQYLNTNPLVEANNTEFVEVINPEKPKVVTKQAPAFEKHTAPKQNTQFNDPPSMTEETAMPLVSEHIKEETTKISHSTHEPSAPKAIEDKCLKNKIEVSIMLENTCPDQQNGHIIVSGIKGGSKPYKVQVFDSQKKEQSYSNLAQGIYSVLVTDAEGCSSTYQELKIKEEYCLKNFEMNPDNGDVWEYGQSQTPVQLSIFDAGEKLYFYKTFAAGEKIMWNGISAKGEFNPGYFLFVVKYLDGKTKEGTITIVK